MRSSLLPQYKVAVPIGAFPCFAAQGNRPNISQNQHLGLARHAGTVLISKVSLFFARKQGMAGWAAFATDCATHHSVLDDMDWVDIWAGWAFEVAQFRGFAAYRLKTSMHFTP